MKKIFSIERYGNLDLLLLMLRVGMATFMIVGHGWPKLLALASGEPVQFISFLGMSPELLLVLAVFAEIVCSAFLLMGLGTRVVVVPLMLTMLVAVFYYHINDPFVQQEMGLHYILVYVLLLFTGSGKYSADYYLSKWLTGRPAVEFSGN